MAASNPNPSLKTGVQARRSERVLLKIPIEVKGRGAEGKTFREVTTTLVINRNGARITLKNSPQPDERVTVTNLYNNLSCPFRIVGRTGKSLGEGPEWGVECLEPERNVWGISFPEKQETPGEGELIDALLECSKCSFRELAQLAREQYRALSAQSSIQRDCPKCKAPTEWQFGFLETGTEQAPAPQPVQTVSTPVPAKKEERRKARRVTLKLPVRVRLSDGRENITRTENYSRLGACFISALEIKEGETVLLTVGYTGSGSDVEAPARVVWRRPIEGKNQTAYGVELQKRD